MATDISVTINPPVTKTVTIGGGITHHAVTHAPGGTDTLEAYYATTGDLIYVSGQISSPAGAVLVTGNQDITGVKNFQDRPTVNGTGVLLSGEGSIGPTGYLTGYVSKGETGQFYPTNNPSGYITGVDLSPYATNASLTGTSGFLQGQLTALNSATGSYVTGNVVRPSDTGSFASTGYVSIVSGGLQSQITNLASFTGGYVTQSQTGNLENVFYPRSNPSGYITGVDLSNYSTVELVTGASGFLQNQITNIGTGAFLTTGAADERYVSQNETGQYTGQFYPLAQNPSGYITGVDLSNYATIPYTTGISGYLNSLINGSSAGVVELNSLTGSITIVGAGTNTVSLSGQNILVSGETGFLNSYVTGDVVRPSETGQFLTSGQTGILVNEFYPRNNPSGYITGVDLSSYATTGYVTGVSGYLQNQILPPLNSGSIGAIFDGGGSTLSTGFKGYVRVPFNAYIQSWEIVGNQTGSIQVDIWKSSYAAFPPTSGNTIAGSEKPFIATGVKNQDASLTTWTTGLSGGDWLAFNVNSCSGLSFASLSIQIKKI